MFAAASLAMMGVGTFLQAYSAYGANKAKQQAYQYNAQLGEMQAKDALARGDQAVQRHYEQASQFRGHQVAAMAANGVDTSFGSALNVLTSTDVNANKDAQIILQNAQREATGYRAQAQLDNFSADSIHPKTAMVTTALQGAGQVGSQWYQFKTAGAF